MRLNWKSKDYLYYKILQFSYENKIGVNTDLEKLCQDKNWSLIPYPKHKMDVLKSISKDGYTVKDGNNFYINYNPELITKCYGRYRFTIAHEIGHIYLYHHIFVDDYVLMHCDDKKAIWEQQADIFAQNLLLPLRFRDYYKKNSIRTIQDKFDVSNEMARTRISKLYQDELFSRKLVTKIKNGTLII